MNILMGNIDMKDKKAVYRMTKSESTQVKDLERGLSMPVDMDKKIADLIGDIKIEVVKQKEESAQEKIGGMITRIEMLVPDRNNYATSKRKV